MTEVQQRHPVLGCVARIDAALAAVAEVEPAFMTTPDKAEALVSLTHLVARVQELQLRVLAGADDVAGEVGARDAAAWLAHHAHVEPGRARRLGRTARQLDTGYPAARQALRRGVLTLTQVEVVLRALEALPDTVDPDVRAACEAHLVEQARTFGPRELRVLGRRVLDVVAPEVADDEERRQLEAEDARAEKATSLATFRRGDGTTEIRARVADAVADRLLTYLQAFTSPRRAAAVPASPDDRRPWDQRLGHALGAFLEAVEPRRLPLHGGDATTVLVTVGLDTLRGGPGAALVGDQPVSAATARRLACQASVLPAVLGGTSEVLDLGRSRRLFSPAQRRALALRDPTCRADGCDIPAAWCEAHHAGDPWSRGGRTDLSDGVLLCSLHHHRAHDRRYDLRRTPGGDVRFHRRT